MVVNVVSTNLGRISQRGTISMHQYAFAKLVCVNDETSVALCAIDVQYGLQGRYTIDGRLLRDQLTKSDGELERPQVYQV